MIELPGLPRTYTSRQIECISCHNYFAVAEEFISANQMEPGEGGENGRQGFRLRSKQLITTRLRYAEIRSNRPIATPGGAAANENPPHPPLHPLDNDICCPRCGADNRNWAQILEQPLAPGFLRQRMGDALPL